jgi:hypothetical protein
MSDRDERLTRCLCQPPDPTGRWGPHHQANCARYLPPGVTQEDAAAELDRRARGARESLARLAARHETASHEETG